MKKKLLNSMRVLLVAVLLGVGASAWATDVPYSIGSYSDGYRGSYSDPYTLETGQTLHLTFVNNNNGTSTVWENFILEATSAVDKHEGVYFDMRADNYAFGVGTFVQTLGGNKTTDLDGATVDMYVTYSGGVITSDAIISKSEVTTYHYKYTYTVDGAPSSVVIYLTEHASVLNITTAEISSWTTVWSTDFSSAPSGMTYSVTDGSTDISNGYLSYHQGGGSGNRALNTAFTDAAYNVSTNWIMEFDWNGSSANTNGSNVIFATDQGTAFSIIWESYATTATIKDANNNDLTTTLPILGYNIGSMTSSTHYTIKGIKDDGIYLTVTYNGTTYVNNVKVSSTYGYPKTFNGTLGRAVSHMYLDNIIFKTPTVAGFVSFPTYTITAPDGTNRKFTLDCATDGATIYYATSDLEIDADGWLTYSSEVSTSAATIYTYAKKGSDTSEKTSFSTGAGTAITLNAPVISLSGMALSAGLYYPTVSITNSQSGLELVPASTTLTYEFNDAAVATSNPYSFTNTGTLKVTVSAEGYTSNSATYVVNMPFLKTKTINLATITAEELSERWTGGTSARLPAANWINRYSSAEFPLYTYNYGSDDASNTDVINGLVVGISSKDTDPGVTPTFYVGAGMILPTKKLNKSDLSESGTWNSSINISVSGATANEIAVYTYPTNYGSSTNTKAIAANENYGLYRYSDMLTKVEVYSPAKSVEVTSAGWATLYTPYALDFSSVENLEAYTATCSESTVTLTKVNNVPAGTGVVLKAAEGSYNIPLATNSSTDKGHLLGSATNATAYNAYDGYTLYMLTLNSDSKAQFVPVTGGNIAAGRAFLKIANGSSSTARSLNVVFADETSGISSMHNSQFIMHNEVYDLQGRSVANGQSSMVNGQSLKKGLYIVNGKKVIVK